MRRARQIPPPISQGKRKGESLYSNLCQQRRYELDLKECQEEIRKEPRTEEDDDSE